MTMPGFTAMVGVAGDPNRIGRTYRGAAGAATEGVQPAAPPRRRCDPPCLERVYYECREDGGWHDECLHIARQNCCRR
jgi:hypothetical protein